MGQLTSVPCELTAPDPPETPPLRIIGKDGKDYDLTDKDILRMSGLVLPGEYWKVFCTTLPAGSELRFVLAAANDKDRSAPSKIRMFGTYAANSDEGSKTIKFDRTLNVIR